MRRFILSFMLLFLLLCAGCGSAKGQSENVTVNSAVEQGSSEGNAGDTMLSSEEDSEAGNHGAGTQNVPEEDEIPDTALSSEEDSEAENHDDAMTQEDASEWEDHVLLTREASLADGRILILEVVGKRVDEGYGVYEVRVYDGDMLIQTVFTAEGNVEGQLSVDEIDSLPEYMKYTEGGSIAGTVDVLDLNFDGNADFGLYRGTGLDSMDVRSYWAWNEEEERYCYIGTMKGLELYPEEGELISQGRPEGNAWERVYYRPDENGELLIERQEIMWAGPERGTNPEFDLKPLWEVWVPREGEKISPRSVRGDSLILSYREVLVKEVYDDGTVSYFLEI